MNDEIKVGDKLWTWWLGKPEAFNVEKLTAKQIMVKRVDDRNRWSRHIRKGEIGREWFFSAADAVRFQLNIENKRIADSQKKRESLQAMLAKLEAKDE